MREKDNVITLKKPGENTDLLTEVLRDGARQLLALAVEAEVDEFLNQDYSIEPLKISAIKLLASNNYLT